MKKLILSSALLLLCVGSFAQTPEIDSLKKYLVFKTDSFNGKGLVGPKDTIKGKNKEGAIYFIMPESQPKWKRVTLTLASPKAGCINDMSRVNFALNDSTKAVSSSDINNCAGMFVISWMEGTFGNKLFNRLANVQVNRLRLDGMTAAVEIYLTPEQSYTFQNQMKWMKYYYDNQRKIDKLKL